MGIYCFTFFYIYVKYDIDMKYIANSIMNKIAAVVISLSLTLLYAYNLLVVSIEENWSWDYHEYIGIPEDQGMYSFLFLLIVFITCLWVLAAAIIFFISRKKIFSTIFLVTMVTFNLLVLTFGFGLLQSHINGYSCYKNQYLSKTEIDTLYNDKVKDIWADLQKQDNRFTSIEISPVDNKLLICPGKYYFLITYDESIYGNQIRSDLLYQSFQGILKQSDYQLLLRDNDYYNSLIKTRK